MLQRGGVVGGTSAGASAISDVMIAGGRGDHPLIGRGFGFLPQTVIDQHFLKRNRLPRLMAAVRRHPGWIGFGIDEGTAIIVRPAYGDFQVIGQSYVVACSSGDVTAGDVTGAPTNSGELRLQSFSPGDEFDLERLRRGELLHRSASSLESLILGD